VENHPAEASIRGSWLVKWPDGERKPRSSVKQNYLGLWSVSRKNAELK